MQKNWLRVFLLCVACAVCLHGNCSAERWVQYFISFGDKIFMDIDSIKAWEYKGRKYLGAYVKGNLVASISKELYVLVDLENERKLELNKSCILNGQIDDRYFDILINTPKNKKIVSPQEYVVLSHGNLPVEKAFMQCAEQNRPDVIQEIRQHNQQYAAQHPQSNVPTGTVADGAANGDYGFVQTLGDGPVQFVPRMIHTPPTYPRERDSITRYYVASVPANGILTSKDQICPPTAPDSHKPLYIIYDILTYSSFSTITIHAIFSYDDATNTFTLYDRFYDFSRPLRKIHIIDKNTVEGTYWDDETYSEDNPLVLQFKYVKALPDNASDRDGFAWTGWDLENDIPAPIDVYFVGNFGASNLKLDYELVYAVSGWNDPNDRNKYCFDEVGLDGLFAFLARKGNVGYAPPAGPRYEYW